ncbi:hypothetical protein FM111_02590 [Brevundimonas diminuta 3F5N]|uniref:Uncharacterized protein n=1 Tax=Brevundimonas diminuta 3F5N TaxID=1255603 RepID=A0A1R4F4X3_BREDI|nr:hypothetical protein FM111_02590 [Brevundimonas diminuta 3F5N]
MRDCAARPVHSCLRATCARLRPAVALKIVKDQARRTKSASAWG